MYEEAMMKLTIRCNCSV